MMVQKTFCVTQLAHGIVPYDTLDDSDASMHWLDPPHCWLAVHGVYASRGTEHWHACCSVLHPYLASPANAGVGHWSHTIGVAHSLSGQQVLPLWHENKLLWPSEVCALAQHSVAPIEVAARFASAGSSSSALLKHESSWIDRLYWRAVVNSRHISSSGMCIIMLSIPSNTPLKSKSVKLSG